MKKQKVINIVMPIVLIMMIPLIGVCILSATDEQASVMPGYERITDARQQENQ